jgi:4-oxalocrotonate tautomerase
VQCRSFKFESSRTFSTNNQKRQIISKLTDAMVSIEGEAMRGVTWCVVEEVESGDWGIAGNALTTADVQAISREGRLSRAILGITWSPLRAFGA